MMFSKILIANRGEIACRIIRTCRTHGIATVTVHSDVDRDAKHVEMADQSVSLGGATPAQSYLRGDAIVAAALATGAQAIHPGYGFLSENPEFVEQIEAAGLVFIGPSAAAIRAMGLKDAAKTLMEEAGVPVVPGYHGASQDNLAAHADDIGYPVLIKAVAGGGGKGMRRVDRAADFDDALKAAQSEARAGFGNADVLIEKYIEHPRHIEVQIFGDGTRVVHLYERDCSLQRRHQKVIEEAPAPRMTDAVRSAMGQAAVRAGLSIGYAGAGTVEFIVDGADGLREDGFWFMEMNTRLQVEHPVTEAVTGIDLVEWQLLVAAGESLPLTQDQITCSGHAFEARIYAEDVPAGFLPATGRLTHLEFGAGRVDSGVRAGDNISPFYDPMIAKLTVHGPSRAIALHRLTAGLADTQIAGTLTNVNFLLALAQHDGFSVGNVDTGLIERDLEQLTDMSRPCSSTMALAAVAALGLDHMVPFQGFSIWAPLRQVVQFKDCAKIVVTTHPDRIDVAIEDVVHQLEKGENGWRIDGQKVTAQTVKHDRTISVFWNGNTHFEWPDPLDIAGTNVGPVGAIEAPMPGLVKDVFVAAGDAVSKGDRLVVLEAMKMEHILCAGRTGTVAEVLTHEGAQATAGAVLIVLEDVT